MRVIQQEFDRYYGALYGERWEALKMALLQSEKQVRLWNSLAMDVFGVATDPVTWIKNSEWHLNSEMIPRGENDLLAYYVLDPASVLVADNLSVVPGERVLDLCAAPGGKSLVLAQSLFKEPSATSELVLNELSMDRRERLKKVVQQYIPRNIRDQIWVKGKDGTRLGLEIQSYFDAILLDAPCSGERHLLENEKELSQWKESRTKGLAQKQYSLLCSAWLALKPGGRLMYSTCSISRLENDGVIEKFLKKKKEAKVAELTFRGPNFENTDYGVIYLPDRAGFGPMYSSLLIKTSDF